MKCPECQLANPQGAKSCAQCGKTFSRICPKCGATNSLAFNYCGECGYSLSGSRESAHLEPNNRNTQTTGSLSRETKPEVIEIAGERKHVTVLFSDLSGYTAMCDKLDPEETKGIIGGIFEEITDVVNSYDAFIEKYIGDAVMAIFGVPKAHEDDPVRAINAAVKIHGLVENLSPQIEKKVGKPLSMHTGINTGLVVTGEINLEKGIHRISGDTINLASRLSNLAKGGEILIGPDTYKATKNYFTCRSLKPIKIKGKSKPTTPYRVLSEKSTTAGGGHELQVSSEMVGREKELAKLELQILKAVNGQGSVINVFGEPGIGKSRLLAELRQKEMIRRVSFLEGRSISIGKNLSFHPIIDLFKQWTEIKEDDTHTKASDKLLNAIRRVCGDEEDEVFPFVATMMGMNLSGEHAQRVRGIKGEALEKLILKNVRQLLIRSTQLIPVVIVMEDLHWADTTSLELLESLFHLARTHRVVFINVYRPGYWHGDNRRVETLPNWLPEVYFTEIHLKPLDKQMTEALVNNMLQVKGLQRSIRKQIVNRAGGNPFFTEEIVRSLIDVKAIVRVNGAFEVTEEIDQVEIPATINDLLTARIDRMDKQTRDLIKVASVIGRSFFDRIIKQVAASIEEVDERLAYLKDAQFIRDRMRMEELEYLFKHALMQEAAYESTLLQSRKELHKKVAQSIELVFRERIHEFYGMLAFHYSKADDLEKAEEYMVKAGDEALRSSASSEALHYFQEALQLYLSKYGKDADPKKLANFEKNIAVALCNKAQWPEAVTYLDKVLERWKTPAPKINIAGIVKGIWNIMMLLKAMYLRLPNSKKTPGEHDNAVFEFYYRMSQALVFFDNTRMFLVTLEIFRRTTKFDLSNIPKLSIYWSAISAGFSVSGTSFRLSNRLLEASKRYGVEGDIESRMNDLCMSNLVYLCQGAWDKIKRPDKELMDAALRLGDLFHISNSLWPYARVKIEQGKFEQHGEIIRELNAIGETYDYGQAIAFARVLKVDYLVKTQNAQDALIESENGILYMREIGNEIQELMLLGYRAKAHQLAGDTEAALDTLSQAQELYERQTIIVLPVALAPYMTARFFVAIGQLGDAIYSASPTGVGRLQKHTHEIGKAAVRNAYKYAPFRTQILRLMGDYYWLIDNQKKALKWWGKSIQEGEWLGTLPDLSRTYFEVGRRLQETRSRYKKFNALEAKDYLENARILFKEMGLKRDLDNLYRLP